MQRLSKKTLLISIAALLLPYTVLPQDTANRAARRPRLAKLVIQVTDPAQEPVRDAQVFVKSKGEDGFEKSVDTNRNGIAKLTGVPLGMLRIQVTGRGWRLWAQDRELNEETKTISVLLEREN